jgi:serine/threonine-protein kinase
VVEAAGALRPTPSTPLIGQTLDGRYRIVRPIGKGGMGTVYLAEHVRLRSQVAVKTLLPELCGSADVVERFHREAVAAASIGSDHIAHVTDMGTLEGAGHYIVMEYLEGADLAWTVAKDGPLDVRRVLRVALQLCEALSAVHAAGIVHRDLKPENLFLVARGGQPDFLKILDFGICKFREALDSMRRVTASGVALGTPQYMPPEQIEGRADIDARADIYAVGAILFFALAGMPPFDAPSVPGVFRRICLNDPPDLRALRLDVPVALCAVIGRALAKTPEERYSSALELRAALGAVLDSLELPALPAVEPAPGASRPTEPQPRSSLIPGRRRWPGRLFLAGVAAGSVGGFLALEQVAPWRVSPEVLPLSAAEPPSSSDISPLTAAPFEGAPRPLPAPAATEPSSADGSSSVVPAKKPSDPRRRSHAPRSQPTRLESGSLESNDVTQPAAASVQLVPSPTPAIERESATPAPDYRVSGRDLIRVFAKP